MNEQPNESREIVTELKQPPTQSIDLVPQASLTPIPREMAAFKIAKIVVYGFLTLFGLPFVYLFVYTVFGDTTFDVVPNVIDMIKTVSAVLSGILGAVIGYYFRTES